MEKEAKHLLRLSKKVLHKATYKKLSQLEDEDELRAAAKYALVSALEQKYHALEHALKEHEAQEKDVFFARNRLHLLPGKIQWFAIDFSARELEKISSLCKQIQKEMRNV